MKLYEQLYHPVCEIILAPPNGARKGTVTSLDFPRSARWGSQLEAASPPTATDAGPATQGTRKAGDHPSQHRSYVPTRPGLRKLGCTPPISPYGYPGMPMHPAFPGAFPLGGAPAMALPQPAPAGATTMEKMLFEQMQTMQQALLIGQASGGQSVAVMMTPQDRIEYTQMCQERDTKKAQTWLGTPAVTTPATAVPAAATAPATKTTAPQQTPGKRKPTTMEVVEIEEGESHEDEDEDDDEVKELTARQQKAVKWKLKKKDDAKAQRDELEFLRLQREALMAMVAETTKSSQSDDEVLRRSPRNTRTTRSASQNPFSSLSAMMEAAHSAATRAKLSTPEKRMQEVRDSVALMVESSPVSLRTTHTRSRAKAKKPKFSFCELARTPTKVGPHAPDQLEEMSIASQCTHILDSFRELHKLTVARARATKEEPYPLATKSFCDAIMPTATNFLKVFQAADTEETARLAARKGGARGSKKPSQAHVTSLIEGVCRDTCGINMTLFL